MRYSYNCVYSVVVDSVEICLEEVALLEAECRGTEG